MAKERLGYNLYSFDHYSVLYRKANGEVVSIHLGDRIRIGAGYGYLKRKLSKGDYKTGLAEFKVKTVNGHKKLYCGPSLIG